MENNKNKKFVNWCFAHLHWFWYAIHEMSQTNPMFANITSTTLSSYLVMPQEIICLAAYTFSPLIYIRTTSSTYSNNSDILIRDVVSAIQFLNFNFERRCSSNKLVDEQPTKRRHPSLNMTNNSAVFKYLNFNTFPCQQNDFQIFP